MSETTEKDGNSEMKDKAADPNGSQTTVTDEIAQLQKQRDEYLEQLQRTRRVRKLSEAVQGPG